MRSAYLLGRPPRMPKEGVTLVRRLWTEQSVTFGGKHFETRDLPLNPKPVQKPAPPIWVAAKKRRAVELAAEVGADGLFRKSDHSGGDYSTQ